jgi:two-component system CheB/CheR fusion protein
VLIVEDNADSCELLCELLAASGFECESAHDGVTGLAKFEASPPDVALVDIGLPELDGFEFARRVRAKREYDGVYLIALTGYGQKQDRERALEAGFDQHLVKPLSPALLMRMLGKPTTADATSEAELELEE